MGDTKTTLVEDLLQKPPSPRRDRLIERARAGYYHDFDTELATPKVQLNQDLKAALFFDLAQRVRDGACDDEEPSPEQAAELEALFRGGRTDA